MPSTDPSFRALEGVKGSNGWARYMVGSSEKIIYGNQAAEPQLIDSLGGHQNLADKSFLQLSTADAIGTLHSLCPVV